MVNNRFCYRISKEAKMCYNEEAKDYCAAYVQAVIRSEKEIPSELKNSMTENLKLGLSSQLGTSVEYLQYIIPKEYGKYTD